MDEQIEVGRAKYPCVASNEFHSKIRRMQLFRKAIDEIVEVLVKAANAAAVSIILKRRKLCITILG